VSIQFLASDYIQHVELPRAKARHKNDALYPIGNGVKQAIEKARLR
jgi:hypothetical protein